MNITDTAQVLAKIQAFNNRTFDQPAMQAWHETIGDLDLPDCLQAVSDYFRASKEWIMPSDIRSIVMGIRNSRIDSMGRDVRLREDDECLDDTKLMIRRHKHLLGLIAAGRIDRDAYKAYHAGTFDIPGMPKELTK